MPKFESKEFLHALDERTKGNKIPPCPFCGKIQYTTTSKVAKILSGDDTHGITLGPNIPAGILVCENCGHIELFALGVLDLLDHGKEEPHGEQK